jgi:multimeric flavodoxin WrbA
MKVIVFNGSPRKDWNTATLLKRALDGAASKGAETELVHLYDLHYSGCRSCYACKLKGGPSYGRCATRDELTPVLAKAAEVDALILGTPIYLGSVSGGFKCFFERLLYPYLVYDNTHPTAFPRKINVGMIYTMGASEQALVDRGYPPQLNNNTAYVKAAFGSCETLFSCETKHTDYSKIVAVNYDAEARERRHREVFPLDCAKAFEIGARFATVH